jgi:thiosulfate reductase cytochrome b subunit
MPRLTPEGVMPSRRAAARKLPESTTVTKSGVSPPTRPNHPWPLRLMHWLNAVAIVVMVGSGWEIYNASPLFGFTFPQFIALG